MLKITHLLLLVAYARLCKFGVNPVTGEVDQLRGWRKSGVSLQMVNCSERTFCSAGFRIKIIMILMHDVLQCINMVAILSGHSSRKSSTLVQVINGTIYLPRETCCSHHNFIRCHPRYIFCNKPKNAWISLWDSNYICM